MNVSLDIVSKLAPTLITLVVGFSALYYTRLQYKVSREKLRLDLFNKRIEAYEKLLEFYTTILREGTVIGTSLPLLAQARYKSQFIFEDEITGKFEEIWKNACEVIELRTKMYGPNSLPVGEERSKICEREAFLVRFFIKDIQESKIRYRRYMQFNEFG